MKKIIKSAMLLLCSAVMFTACSDDNDANPTIQIPESFVLNTPAYANTAVDLGTTTAIDFTWNQPNYGFPASVDYQLQVSKDGNFTVDLATVAEGEEATANFATLSDGYPEPKGTMRVSQLSPAINSMNGWDETTVPEVATVYVRALAVTKGAPTIYSNVVSIKVNPSFNVAPSYAEFIYMMGNFNGWSDPVEMRSPNFDGIYQCYNWIDGGFKFKPNKDNWDGDWGQDPNGDFGTLVVDGEEDCNKTDGSFTDKLADPGFYQVDVSLVDMTWSITKVESISIIGTVNGNWDNDTDMTYNQETGAWEVTTTLAAGKMKFRMNHDWAISWGGSNGSSTAYDDLTQYNGTDLDVEAGTYLVQLYIIHEGANKVVLTAK